MSNTLAGRRGHDEQATYVPHYYVEDFEDGTLTSSTGRIDRHPLVVDCVGPLQTGQTPNGHSMAGENAVRRLTPRECERLQAFPDDWTDGPDSRRYAALGDAVTVNVAEWLGRRMLAIEAA